MPPNAPIDIQRFNSYLNQSGKYRLPSPAPPSSPHLGKPVCQLIHMYNRTCLNNTLPQLPEFCAAGQVESL